MWRMCLPAASILVHEGRTRKESIYVTVTRKKPLEISRRYLHDEAAERLRDLIIGGTLAPGDRVNESELCEDFGISRTPMREAIKILAAEKLLELLPNHGARVAQMTKNELSETLEVIAILEAAAAEQACNLISDEELGLIEAHHNIMVKAWEKEDEPVYFKHNKLIHETIVAASRNKTLMGIYASLSGRVQEARYTAHKTPAQWQKAINEHEEILRLLKAGESHTLFDCMRSHIRGKAAVIAAAFGLEDE